MTIQQSQTYHARHLHPRYHEIATRQRHLPSPGKSRPLRITVLALFAVAINFVCAPAAANSNQHSSYGLQVGSGICVIVGICFAVLGILDYILGRRS